MSYTSHERERALAVADALEGAGIRVWIDRQQIDLLDRPGAAWLPAMLRALALNESN